MIRQADPLPETLAVATQAFAASELYREAFGAAFVDYYARVRDRRNGRVIIRRCRTGNSRNTSTCSDPHGLRDIVIRCLRDGVIERGFY